MKIRWMIGFFCMAIVATALSAGEVKLDTAKLQEIKTGNKVLQDPALEIVDAIDKESVYFLKLKASSQRGSQIINAFLDKKTGAIYFGNGYNKEGNPLVFPKEAKPIMEGVSFSYGMGAKELYLVTDPECPYCSKFAQASAGKLGDYRVHVIFLPLSFHKNAPAMVEWILQGKDDAEKKERYDQITLKNATEYKKLITDATKPFAYTPATKEMVAKSLTAVQELGARGTPALYDALFRETALGDILSAASKTPAPQK